MINELKENLSILEVREKKKDSRECTKCFKILSLDNFDNDSRGKYGKEAKCKSCKREYQRKHRFENPEKYKKLWSKYVCKNKKANQRKSRQSPEGRIKHNAREKLRAHVKVGKIKKRNSCEICYNSPTQCHHEDYGKPLNFIELCGVCHKFLHNKIHYLISK